MSGFKSLALLLAAQLANAQGGYPNPPVAGLPVSHPQLLSRTAVQLTFVTVPWYQLPWLRGSLCCSWRSVQPNFSSLLSFSLGNWCW